MGQTQGTHRIKIDKQVGWKRCKKKSNNIVLCKRVWEECDSLSQKSRAPRIGLSIWCKQWYFNSNLKLHNQIPDRTNSICVIA